MSNLGKVKALGGFFTRLEDLKKRMTSVEERTAKFNKITERGWMPTAIEAVEYQQLNEDRVKLIVDYRALQVDWKVFNEASENNDS